ncbi:hypothetical protein A4X09_0g2499 [Tilletia walkeri]|uniref:DNA 3'-5' helicase n=1 Tax=Tilletia walkeri TaxID=117179 RepID=A0A8X7T704_9BASI|nr:hypothetical protein A4X09_0g2499 [Tilletia walkeri]
MSSASLYSLAAQQDAIALDQEAERLSLLQHGPNSSARESFFRPYQAAPQQSRQGPSSHQSLYGQTARSAQLIQSAVQPIHRPQPTAVQRQHFFPVPPAGSAQTPSEQFSSPSPVYRGWEAGRGELNTPGRSEGSELTLGLEMEDAYASLNALTAPQRTAYPHSSTAHISALTPQSQRQPLMQMQLEQQSLPSRVPQSENESHSPATRRKSGTESRSNHGVRLKPVTALPDMWRSIFKFPVFNAVQSTCFDSVFQSNRNVVVSAPTGSGKTVVFELAIIRMLQDKNASAKGDTNFAGLSAAKNARVIITTPSLTRRWTDHDKILSNLALLLIDEVHILHEKGRGARLEVIVSRMKNYGQQIRFVAVSATFGEDFRPCHLSKFVYGYPKLKDDFVFTASLNKHLLGLIQEHAKAKPCLVFVSTRKGTVQAADAIAKQLATLEAAREPVPWTKPTITPSFQDPKLEELAAAGIAFHHAGMVLDDRRAVEQAFLSGTIKVLCATTTLATGVNLPAYCVIIRGTKQYAGGGWAEISDLDFVQMIGRAGRPQFDTEGVAVVMTETTQKQHYMDLASGNTVIESSLAAELVEHINAELVLRGTSNKQAIESWIEGTFLHVRLLKNPAWYNLDESAASKTSKEVMQSIVEDALNQLDRHDLATATGEDADELAATDLGDILAKYFLTFKTMLLLLQAPQNATIKDLIELLTEAEEFKDIRMRQGEKNNEEIRFPPVKVNGVKEKVSLLLQAVLAGLPLQECLGSKTVGYSPALDAFTIFRHAPRIVKAMFDIFLAKGHGQALQNAFTLLRSINGRSWEGKPAVLRQLEGVGEKTLKILSGAGLLTLGDVAGTDPRRIELLMNRNPPFGDKLVNQAKAYPHFHLDVEQVGEEVQDQGVQVTIKVKVGLQDMGVKVKTSKKESGAALAVCVLTMSSDLTLFDFRKMPLKKLSADKEFKIKCRLDKPSQRIVVTAACDEIAGSAVRSELRHSLPASSFPKVSVLGKTAEDLDKERALQELEECIDFFDKDDDLDLDLDDREGRASTKPTPSKASIATPQTESKGAETEDEAESDHEPEKLPNGNYKCMHQCKSSCRHLCCREGMERPPQKKKWGKKKASTTSKATAEPAGTPTLLERLRTDVEAQPAKDRKQKTAQAAKAPTSRSGSGSHSAKPNAAPEREPPQLAGTGRLELSRTSKDKDPLSDEDDELPLLFASRSAKKRKYDVNWTAFEGIDNDSEPTPNVQKKKRAKITFSKYIDDEAGEDNRPEHAAKGKNKAKTPRLPRRKDDADTSHLSEDEDTGSLADFIVDDHIDPTIDFSEDDLALPNGDHDGNYEGGVSRGDLVDCGMDDLADLFSDSEDEDDPKLEGESRNVRVPSKPASRVLRSPSEEVSQGLLNFGPCGDDDDLLFFSEDCVPELEHGDAPFSKQSRRASLSSVDSAIGKALAAAEQSREGEIGQDDQDVVNEDTALGVQDAPSPVPPFSRNSRHREDPLLAQGKAIESPGIAVGPQQQQSRSQTKATTNTPAPSTVPDRPAVRRPLFADRMLAKMSSKNSTPKPAATVANASGVKQTGEAHRPADVSSRQEIVPVSENIVPSIPGDDETWGDWDLLKG